MGLKEQSLRSLRNRQLLGRELLRYMRKENMPQDVIEHYQGQLREITAEIRRRTRAAKEAEGWEKPPAEVVQMKPARMGASAPKRGVDTEQIIVEARRVIAAAQEARDGRG